MKRKLGYQLFVAVMVATSLFLPGCSLQNNQSKGEVVVYTSVDQVYSEPIFKAFEEATDIVVKPVYDIEANKTVGLANRLEAEKNAPQADVFWNGEVLQTIALKKKDVFEAISLTEAELLPAAFKDPDEAWFAFGGRGRVLLYNKALIQPEDCPQTMADIPTAPRLNEMGIAYPIFGTTNTQAAALYANWGEEKARAYYQSLKDGGIMVVDGNSVIKDFVSQKKLAAGLTDTDDALSEMKNNEDLGIVFLDQGEGGMGTMVIPNTVARVKGGPNANNAAVLMNYLLSASTEQQLVDSGWIQIPVHEGVTPDPDINLDQILIMAVDFNQAGDMLQTATADMTEIFVR